MNSACRLGIRAAQRVTRGWRPTAAPALHRQRLHAAAASAAAAAEAPEPGEPRRLSTSSRRRQQQQRPEWTLESAGAGRPWQRTDLRVVLVHPQIPQNTGNVGRTCAATNTPLHLVGPMGFEIDNRRLKRAGLDYWPMLGVVCHADWQTFAEHVAAQPGTHRLIAYSKLGRRHYAEEGLFSSQGGGRGSDVGASEQDGSSSSGGGGGDGSTAGTEQAGGGGTAGGGSSAPAATHWLLFGAETTGLPPEAHAAAAAVVKIPISQRLVRSLNLASSVGIGLYEALRQLDGAVLPEDEEEGEEERGWLEDRRQEQQQQEGQQQGARRLTAAEAALVAAGVR